MLKRHDYTLTPDIYENPKWEKIPLNAAKQPARLYGVQGFISRRRRA
ncbi:hypothetical protein SACS_1511 [Parasaccharibacter apium]|uniref:Uncharacterized protein n=1 Tax=Parasaccharibacter apium TaxID=1510841 RepID=A0A7U7J1C3_9PROT|nr:hypothetical protein SACS_1511 [Parasaccharibacter apium]